MTNRAHFSPVDIPITALSKPLLSTFKHLKKYIRINIAEQTLSLYAINPTLWPSTLESTKPLRIFKVSTAKNGIGNMEGSGCTPLGSHIIAKKFGHNQAINSVYVGRRPTGEVYSTELGQNYPDRDWIMSRILWLEGCEQGFNLGDNDAGCCDTYQRYIYIHGTPDTEPMGIPLSHGCIRMRNTDICWLFEQVKEGDLVEIVAAEKF